MSTVFSRRSFLKYTAVAAVAVAGTSLLGGCSGSGAETAIQTTYPSDNVVLKVKSTLETLEYDPTDGMRPLRSISSTAARIPSS
ncbi:MAG: twin-arginine translocation signal domain-containing protein [Faecalibacterium sp.]